MESSAVAARAERAGLAFYCIKVVSDRADESFPFDLNRMRTSDGHVGRGKIGLYVAVRPSLIPAVLHWKRRSEKAAQILGDFLVSCRIKPELDSALAT